MDYFPPVLELDRRSYNICKNPTSRKRNDKCDHLAISSLCSKHHMWYFRDPYINLECHQLSLDHALLGKLFAFGFDRYLDSESIGLILLLVPILGVLNFPTFFLLLDYLGNRKSENVLAKYHMEILNHILDNAAIVKDSQKFHASLKWIFWTSYSKICILLGVLHLHLCPLVAVVNLHLVIWQRYQRIIGGLFVELSFAIYFGRPYFLWN